MHEKNKLKYLLDDIYLRDMVFNVLCGVNNTTVAKA
jgi:hypothetical protein